MSRLTRCLAAVALAATSLAVTSAPKASAAPPPDAMRRWAATMGGSQVITQDQAIKMAGSFDVIVGFPKTFAPYLAAMRAANPGIRFIAYMNGAYAQEAKGSAYPDDWYTRDAAGMKVVSAGFGNFFMDVAGAGWTGRVTQECTSDTATSGWDGCYLDMLGPGTLTPGYLSAPPVNPATGSTWTKDDLVSATAQLATTVQLGNPDRYIIANGLGTGRQYFDPAWGPTSKLLNGISGGNAQGFIRGASTPIGQARSLVDWKRDVDMLADAGAMGRSVFSMTKIWGTPATQKQKDAVHRYALASFLLGTDGNQYFFWSDDGDEGANAQQHPYDAVSVGQPLGPYTTQASGAVVRRFNGATVVANPTAASVTVDLGATMTSLDGNAARTVTLPAHAGDVFTS